MDEVKKFEILTDINNNKLSYSTKTLTEIKKHLCKHFDTEISTHSLRKWSKMYGFTYKTKRKPNQLSQHEELKRTNQRIRILGIVIRNLCKQLEISHPTMLDRLIEGITEQYGTAPCFETNTKELEDKIYAII